MELLNFDAIFVSSLSVFCILIGIPPLMTGFLFVFLAVGLIKSILALESQHISEFVVETTKESNEEMRETVIWAAEKMLKDYQIIQAIFKQNGV